MLALRELEELSYDEIAEIMGMNRNSVAQLISRARINLRDTLRGTALATVATSSLDCERALALLAARQDGQGDEDADWLDDHMADCETCPLSRAAMEEAGLSYRSWAPVLAAPLMFRETVAHAAETVGADWSQVARPGRSRLLPGGSPVLRHMRRDLALVGALTLVLFFVALAAKTHEGAPVTDAVPAAEETPAATVKASDRKKPAKKKARRVRKLAAAPLVVAPDEPLSLPGNGSDAAGTPPSREPSRRLRVDRDAGRNGAGGLIETPQQTVPEELPAPEPVPEPEPQPEPDPRPVQPPPTQPPCIPPNCKPGPD